MEPTNPKLFEKFNTNAKQLVNAMPDVENAWRAMYGIGVVPDEIAIMRGLLRVLSYLDDVPEFAGMIKAGEESLARMEAGKRPRSEAQSAALAKAREIRAAKPKKPLSAAQIASLAKAHKAVRDKAAAKKAALANGGAS